VAAGLVFIVPVQLERIWRADPNRHVLALARDVAAAPDDLRFGTTWWPAERTLNLYAGRHVPLVTPDALDAGEVDRVVVRRDHPDLVPDGKPIVEVGPYAIIEAEKAGAAE
jgi:hypothetical protein